MSMTYTYLVWSLLLVLVWGVVFIFTGNRRKMLKISLGTAPLGLTEPFFYPEYWSPPTLFALGENYGFDVESLFFSFAVGGLACSLYELGSRSTTEPMPANHKQHVGRHRFHALALVSPAFVFAFLELATGLNSIYTASLSLLFGAIATVICRVDLLGSAIFTGTTQLSVGSGFLGCQLRNYSLLPRWEHYGVTFTSIATGR